MTTTVEDCPHGDDPNLCPPCQRAADQGHGAAIPTGPDRLKVIVARRTTYCPACDEIVVPGDEIAAVDDTWVHHPECSR